jgi:hypothetical protein
MQNRTVAIFDILGFGQMVKTTPLAELAQLFEKTVDGVLPRLTDAVTRSSGGTRLLRDSETTGPWCLLYSFSDTIILISHDETEVSCLKVLLYSFRVLQYLILSKLYSRAGITFGEMFVDQDRKRFLGKALVDAYEIEKAQDWIGGTISKSLEDAFPRLFDNRPILDNVFPFYEVPMKEGPVRKLRTINWRWNIVAQEGTRKLFESPTNWPERKKVENTLAYAAFIKSTSRAYPEDPDCPVEVQRMYVGSGPPPPNAVPNYPHGDEL